MCAHMSWLHCTTRVTIITNISDACCMNHSRVYPLLKVLIYIRRELSSMVLTENNLRQIQSFVMFDLETSGLHRQTRITEIGLVAALREHIRDANKSDKNGLPRVLHKINLCVYPSRLIDLGASDVSGLDNVLLQEQKPFDCDVFSILECFLRRLPSPVCLIAHNGDKFDFPILQAELRRIDKVFPDDVMCADSFKCFKELFTCKNDNSSASNECNNHVNRAVEPEPTTPHQCLSEQKNIGFSSDLGIYPLTRNIELEDEYDGVLFNVLDAIEKEASKMEGSVSSQNLVKDDTAAESTVTCRSSDLDSPHMQQQNEKTPKIGPDAQESSETIAKNDTTTDMSEIQKQNETTPKIGVRKPKSNIISRNIVESTVGDHSVGTTPSRKRTIKNTTAVRKRLNFTMPAVGAVPKSFKLTDVYKFLCGCEPENAHTADGDAINLLRCIVAVGDDFLEWTDNNARRLSEVVPRY